MAAASSSEDRRLLEAAASAKTDLVLQLLEEEGQHLHSFRDQVRKDGTRRPTGINRSVSLEARKTRLFGRALGGDASDRL